MDENQTAHLPAGLSLIVSKRIGLSGTVTLAREHYEDLRERFPERMLREILSWETLSSVTAERELATAHGAAAIYPLAEGGISAALWQLAEDGHCGLTADLAAVPIRQETIEVCEFYDINPYEMESRGSLLIAVSDGKKMAAALQDAGIPSEIIGETTDSAERVFLFRDKKRYLTPPRGRS